MTAPGQSRGVLDPTPEAPAPRPRPPLVCGAVLAGSVAMMLLDRFFTEQVFVGDVAFPLKAGALWGPMIEKGQWWRLFWTVFEHAGPIHLLFNMSVVWTLGFALERAIGSWRLALISLVSTLGASSFVLLFNWDQPTVGASGMLLGWMAAMIPIANEHGRRQLLTWLIQIAVITVLPLVLDSPFRISWSGHLGGFLLGLPCGWALRGGAVRFRYAAPVALFFAGLLTVVAASGRYRW